MTSDAVKAEAEGPIRDRSPAILLSATLPNEARIDELNDRSETHEKLDELLVQYAHFRTGVPPVLFEYACEVPLLQLAQYANDGPCPVSTQVAHHDQRARRGVDDDVERGKDDLFSDRVVIETVLDAEVVQPDLLVVQKVEAALRRSQAPARAGG